MDATPPKRAAISLQTAATTPEREPLLPQTAVKNVIVIAMNAGSVTLNGTDSTINGTDFTLNGTDGTINGCRPAWDARGCCPAVAHTLCQYRTSRSARVGR
eukprot:2404874-Rhodomonas_salina.4